MDNIDDNTTMSESPGYFPTPTIPLLFFLLGFLTMIWLFGFHFIFTIKCMSSFFKSIGVKNARLKRLFQELKRKSFHLLGLLIPAIYWFGLHYSDFLDWNKAILILGTLTLILWIVELLRVYNPKFRLQYNKIFASILRKSETEKNLNNMKFTGNGFFFLGNFLTILLYAPNVAICSSLFLILGDLSAALIGMAFGSIKIGSKSLEGSLAMFTVCFIISSVVFWPILSPFSLISIGGPLVATLVELLGPPWLDDNLSIPLSSGFALTVLLHLTV